MKTENNLEETKSRNKKTTAPKGFLRKKQKNLETKTGGKVMKTLNKNTETRKSKFKNALLRSGAVIISFVLISFTVSAQGFWKQLLTESSLSQFAMIMVGDAVSELPSESNYYLEPASAEAEFVEFSLETEFDQPLEVEEWMTTESYFGASFFNIVEENDASLKVEEWMTESNYFTNDVVTEKDQELKIENWMVTDNIWNL